MKKERSTAIELFCNTVDNPFERLQSQWLLGVHTYPLKVTVEAGSVSVIKIVLSTCWKIVGGLKVCVSRTVLSIVNVTGSGVT